MPCKDIYFEIKKNMIRSVRFFLYFSVSKCLRSKKSNYGLVSTSELGIIVARWIYSKKKLRAGIYYGAGQHSGTVDLLPSLIPSTVGLLHLITA